MANAARRAANSRAQGLSCAQNPGGRARALRRTSARLLRAGLLAGAGLLALAPAYADETITYSYDARGRLKQVAHNGTANNGVTAAYTFDKADNRATATVTGVGSPSSSFSIAGGSTVEGGQITFTVSRSITTGTGSVSYATADGTAHAGTDYTSTLGTLNFTAGQASLTFTVPTTDDALVNGTRTFSANLSNPTGGVIGTGQATGTITDNDSAVFSIGPSTVSATEGQPLSFTVTRSGTATGTYTVNYSTADGTANAGSDYNAKSGTLTFTGSGTQSVTVTTIDDTLTENNETFSVNLSSPSGGATIAPGQGTSTGTIIDNDPATLTVTVPGGGPVNLRSLASNYSNQTSVTFNLLSGSTVTGGAGGGAAIDTGSWPAGVTLALNISGTVLGGGGNGGNGGGWNGTANYAPANGGAGGDAISCHANFTITVNGSAQAGGGGGGGGGYVTFTGPPGGGIVGGTGGGGGAPNGAGGAGGTGKNGGGNGAAGAAGTTSGGGAGGTGTGPQGGNGGGYATAGSTGAATSGSGGTGGAAGYAVRKNGTTCSASGNITGTVG